MSTEVDLATLASVARSLRQGGQDVEGAGRRSTPMVDAGEMTGLVRAMVAEILDHAATLSEGLHNAATAVSDSHESYAEADAQAGARFPALEGG